MDSALCSETGKNELVGFVLRFFFFVLLADRSGRVGLFTGCWLADLCADACTAEEKSRVRERERSSALSFLELCGSPLFVFEIDAIQ